MILLPWTSLLWLIVVSPKGAAIARLLRKHRTKFAK
jgi:hypothetical protein